MNKVLVTGGCGFLGSHVVHQLINNDFHVVIVDKNIDINSKSSKTTYLSLDLSKEAIPNEIINSCTKIIHLAGFSDLNASINAPLDTVFNNVVVTTKLLEQSVRAKIDHFIFASTVYVYSQGGGFYKASKQACEVYIDEFHKRYGLNYSILRYGSLYGLNSGEDNGMYNILNEALTSSKITHYGRPEERREYINVVDAANLTVKMLDENYKNDNYILTGNQSITKADLYSMISEILDKSIDVKYKKPVPTKDSSHYTITPYTYLPKPGKKLHQNCR